MDDALASALRDYMRHVEHADLIALLERAQAGASQRAFLQLPSSSAAGAARRPRSTAGAARRPLIVPCEAWLIRWPPGAVAPLHDHGSAHGIAQVVSGSLHELRFVSNATSARELVWASNVVVALPHGTCHEVRNRTQGVAYSIHVYAPRLEYMTFYARDHAGKLRPTRQEVAIEWRNGTHG